MFSQAEIDKFNDLAHEWWNPEGEFKTLHQINPARVEFILKYSSLNQKKLIDGCKIEIRLLMNQPKKTPIKNLEKEP